MRTRRVRRRRKKGPKKGMGQANQITVAEFGLAVVLDPYSRAVVGWAMDGRMTRELVIAALTMAI